MGAANPFRYRGYYYDTETGLYYLQSRYYDPQVGRFINADGSVNANGDITGFNMFAYCSNNPVMYSDPSGEVAGVGVLDYSSKAKVKGENGAAALVLSILTLYLLAQSQTNTAERTATITWSSPKEKIKTKEATEEATKDLIMPGIPIYRYGSYTFEKLTPDNTDWKGKKCGLSFNLKPPRLGQEATMTTIQEINSTGILYAKIDGKSHVSITPTNATVKAWYDMGPSSIWTITLMVHSIPIIGMGQRELLEWMVP